MSKNSRSAATQTGLSSLRRRRSTPRGGRRCGLPYVPNHLSACFRSSAAVGTEALLQPLVAAGFLAAWGSCWSTRCLRTAIDRIQHAAPPVPDCPRSAVTSTRVHGIRQMHAGLEGCHGGGGDVQCLTRPWIVSGTGRTPSLAEGPEARKGDGLPPLRVSKRYRTAWS